MKIQVLYAISALFATLAICDASSLDGVLGLEWKAYKAKHGKVYEDFEDDQRFEMFLKKKRQVAEHNKRFYSGQETYQIGINQFSDKLDHESGPSGCLRRPQHALEEAAGSVFVPPPANVELPDSVDWRKEGAVTPVKDQGMCGSCWAFSSTGALEGQHFLKTGKMVPLSEENLVDCVRNEKGIKDGCMGGLMSDAFNYVAKNHGIDTEASYPYVAGTDGFERKCNYSTTNIGATDNGFTNITTGDEEALKAAVATKGPISVSINVAYDFFDYISGVFVSKHCWSDRWWLNHAVLVVGYGTDKKSGMDYWLVKNSWGAKWGEDGYIRMARNKNNMCGIATAAMYPNV